MKETAQLQKQILERKLSSISQSLKQIQVKRKNLEEEEEKLKFSKEKISKTLKDFGKSDKERSFDPSESKVQKESKQRRSLTEEEKKLIPPFILEDSERLEEYRERHPELN